ncbi:MAG: tetratricopeptide repeat protein [Sphaerotilus sp.]|jgi:tetratricopeptide (TPR) repeat protein|nr:tetratricopeptide repeat protein [Sphaerotilus sp.]
MNPLQFLLALALEAGAALLLWTGERDVLQLGAYLAVHALACAVLALALLPLLPGRLRQPPLAVLALLFSLAFFIPFLGLVALLLAVVVMRMLPVRERDTHFRLAAPPEFLLSVRDPPRLFRGLSIRQLLTDVHAAATLRTRALNAIASKPARIAGDLLRKLLSDPVEDLRLVAYGLLDTQEKALRTRISEQAALLEQLTTEPHRHSASRIEVLRHLAELNFELVYQSLVQGDVREHTLARAIEHAQAAIALDPGNGGLRQLLARMHLEQGDIDRACDDLIRATEDGLPDNRVLPYLAEMAYRRGDWRSVRALMHRIDPLTVTPRMAALVRYWQTAGERP